MLNQGMWIRKIVPDTQYILHKCSVADSFHFDLDPYARIRFEG